MLPIDALQNKQSLPHSSTRKHKPRAHRGVDHPVTELGPGEIIEAVAGAVAGNDVFGIDRTEFGDHQPDVVVVERRYDVKPADDGEHLVNARGGHRGADRIDDAAMAAGGEYHEPASLHVVDGGDLVIKVVRDVNSGVFFRRHVFGETAEAVKDANDLRRRTQRLLERNLPDAAGGEGVIGDDGWLRRPSSVSPGIENSLTVKSAELTLDIAAYAKGILSADIERDLLLQRAAVLLKEPDHASEMIIMPMAQDHCVERGRIDPDDRHVVVEDLGREAEVDEYVTHLATGERLRV